jgi:hypothetical protein
MPRYKVEDRFYNVPEDNVQDLLAKYPNATLVEEEEVKIEGAPSVDAAVAPKPEVASESTGLDLEAPSLVSPEDKQEMFEDLLGKIKPSKILTEEEKYDQAVRITEQEKLDIEDEVLNISLEPVKKYIGRARDIGAKPIIVQPYEEEVNQARDYLIKNSVDGSEPTNEEVYSLTKKRILNNKLTSLSEKKQEDYISILPESIKENLKGKRAKQYTDITYETSRLVDDLDIAENQLVKSTAYKTLENLNSYISTVNPNGTTRIPRELPEVTAILKSKDEIDGKIKELNRRRADGIEATALQQEIQADIEIYEKQAQNIIELDNGVLVTKNFLKDYNNIFNQYAEKEEYVKNLKNKVTNSLTKQEEYKLDLAWLNKNYDLVDQLGAIVAKTGGAMAAGTLRFGVDIIDTYANMMALKPIGTPTKLNEIAETTKKVQERAMKDLQEDYPPQVAFEDAFKSPENFGKFYLQAMAGQIPVIAALTLGSGGIGIIGASGYGQKINDIETLDKERGTETSNLEKRLTALGFGVAEAGLGSLNTLRIFNKTVRDFDVIKKGDFYKGAGDYIVKNAPDVLDATASEFVFEGATVFAQNGIEVLRGEMDIQDIFQNVPAASVTGGLLGLTLSGAPILKGTAIASLTDFNKMAEFKENASAISILNNEMEGMDKRTNAYKTRLKLVQELTERQSETLEAQERNIATIMPEALNKYIDITTQQVGIANEAKSIYNRADLSNANKRKRLDILQREFARLGQIRNIFKNDFQNDFVLESNKIKNKYTDLAKAKLTAKGITDKKQIDKEAQKIYTKDKLKETNEQAYNSAKKLAKKYNLKINYQFLENNDELLSIARQDIDAAVERNDLTKAKGDKLFNQLKKSVKDGTVNGANLYLGSNNHTVLISETNALNNGKTQTPVHELGHIVFMETLGLNKLGYGVLANKIKEYLRENNKAAFNRIQERTRGQEAEEVLTNYLEEVSRLDLESQKNRNFISGVGASINSIVSKLTGKENSLFFQGPPDIINFLESLQKSIKEGNFDDLTIEADTRPDEAIIKESRTEAASDRVQALYDTRGTEAAFDIIQEFKPITSRLVERRSQAPGFDRQLLTDEIETGARGILDLIQEYKPESGVPLAAYINRFLPSRTIEASRRVLGEEFTTDVTEAREVVAEEVAVVETPVKPEKRRIDPFRIMDIKREATEEVRKNIADKDVDVTTVTYKELKDIAPYKAVADFFNIPVSRISNPKDNLRKGDNISDIQRWILKNEPTLKNLFTEANREVVEVEGPGGRVIRKGGEPTGIPRNLLKTFYTKGKRVGNNFQWTLKPYDRNTFLEAVGIKEGKVDPDFVPRSAEAQTMKGLLEMYARNLGNVVAREVVDADIDIKPEVKARAKVEIAKGKPRLMFSVQNLNNINNEFMKSRDLKPRTLSPRNNADIEFVKDVLINVMPKYIPVKNFYNSANYASAGNSESRRIVYGQYFLGTEIQEIKKQALKNQGNFTKEQIKDIQVAIGKKSFNANFNSNEYRNKTKSNYRGAKFIANQLAKMVKENPETAPVVTALFSTASRSSGHWFRQIAMPRGKDTKLNGERIEKEHVWPQNEAAEPFLTMIFNNTVDSDFNVFEDNYFQIGLSLDNNGKLKGDDYTYQSKTPPEFLNSVMQGLNSKDLSKIISVWLRYYNNNVNNNRNGIDPNSLFFDGKTIAEFFNVNIDINLVNQDVIAFQNKLIYQQIIGDITSKKARNLLNKEFNIAEILPNTSKANNKLQPVGMKHSKTIANQEQLQQLGNLDRAFGNAKNINAPTKGISVWDFDDTLAVTKSKVLYTLPDGTKGKLSATEFAKRASELTDQDAEFDFKEFDVVTKGAKGPMFEKAIARNKKFGNQNVFILTARPMAAAEPIHTFLKSIGLDIPVKNIVGLADGTAEAKARWVVGKAAEGYNDFYFADDAYKNVKAVQDALSVLDVKSKVRQAYVKFSKSVDLDKEFNDIIEAKTGIASEKEYKRVKAQVAGAGKGRLNFFIPPSAEDFTGLLYATLAKGKLGDDQMAWYKLHLLDPYARAMQNISKSRLALMNDYKALKKELNLVPKNLRKKVPGEPYTREQAVRVYIWNKQNMEVPGISKADLKDLTDYVNDNAELQVFADQLIEINKGDGYAKPKFGWPAGSITTDLLQGLNTTKRSKYLELWQQNVDVIFSEKNLNKLEAAYGKPYREALENMLQRMKTGRNRNFAGDTITGKFTDWLTGSIGTIMFFNTRSALLQTISSINFINFSDNNPLAAARAFANQKQYWSDFMKLMNSDFLKERRAGLRINVNEADIADMAKKGGVQGVINRLLELGFIPTQIADSFAIASGGATFYRNRVKTYEKDGMDKAAAEKQALNDWRELAEENQQSSRPDRISMQQAGPLGRIILAFANTPAQYARLIKKAASDLRAGRGDARTNISKILYYGFVQNLIFNALQQALFAFAFGDEEPEDQEKQEKYVSIANGMADSLLRGAGIGGALVSVGKNAIMRIQRELEKDQPKLDKVAYELSRLSPPISSKLSRINQAARSYQWDKEEMINGGWSLDNPAFLAGANVISALTNIPLDRAVKKATNVSKATTQDIELWERLALLGGWQDWEIGLDKENKSNKPSARKTTKPVKIVRGKKVFTKKKL